MTALVSRTLIVIGCLMLAAAPPTGAQETGERDKLVLVLSGGGARGAAHIGVLRVLEELEISPDLVVGTSMGSVVGGLYAAGWSPDEIERLVHAIDWGEIFSDRVDRRELSFRRKQDDRPLMIRGFLHFDGFRPLLPSGVIQGQRLELVLRFVEAISPTTTDFDDLPIPFRAVAAELGSGEAVILGSGSLATAIRASMSVPGALPPVEIDGRLLVDGGVAANLPVGIARRLGATRIIAVDITSPLAPQDEAGSFASVLRHLTELLTANNRDRDAGLLDQDDVLIVPELGELSFIAFDRMPEAIAAGEQAARNRAPELRRFASPEARWAEAQQRPRPGSFHGVAIDEVRLDNTSRLDDRLVRHALDVHPPQEFDLDGLTEDLLQLYNTRYFGVLGFEINQTAAGAHELLVHTPPPPYGHNALQLGFGFLDDFDGGATYHLQARHQMLPVNRRGGEWQTLFQIGSVAAVRTEFYQPLDWGMRWFVEPALEYRRGTQELWFDGNALAEYEFTRAQLELAAGRVLGRWGELRLTAFTSDNSGEPRIGDPEFFGSDSERLGGGELSFRIDTEDSVAFPRSGADVNLYYSRSADALGSDYDFERWWGTASYAWSFGENTIVPGLEYGENIDDITSFFSLFNLGGLFRLSGLGTRELLGDRMALARIVGYRRLVDIEMAGINVKLYAGASVEAGNAFLLQDTSFDWDTVIKAGSVFLGADTFLGPAILAYGLAEGGRSRVYLAIGDSF
jgi:NTE family protein